MSTPELHKFVTHLGDEEITFECGQLAGQADGAVVIRSGDCLLLTTAVASKDTRDVDFLPLSVDFEEKLYAAGRIPGSFFRREGRPSEEAILICRLTDRPLRPLFDKTARNDIQIIITALSSDGDRHLDILAVNSASAALTISDIPWAGPIGAVRIGRTKEGEFMVNPSISQMEESVLDLRLAGTEDAISMVEAGADEVPEDVMLEALRLGHEAIQEIIQTQKEMRDKVGQPKREFITHDIPEETGQKVREWLGNKIEEALKTEGDKLTREAALDAVRDELAVHFEEDETVDLHEAHLVYSEVLKEAVRAKILQDGERPDGREAKQIRSIWGDVGILPRAHGSGLFTRGETQVLTVTTFGTPREEQRLDTLGPKEVKRYIHHYNFPPFSTGETGRLGSPRRRAIGHGALAERALRPVLPDFDTFPYTLRLVSEVLSSNGSSSMASVCGSTLSLMDAGVPITTSVAGIAMGLIQAEDRFVVLADIQGIEDALGDMDFKVAGTEKGITALQMDIKIKGLRWDVLRQALHEARNGRLFILDKMRQILGEPRQSYSPYAPSITTIQIDPEKIGKIIGPGGKMIRAIQEETNCKIDIDDDGTVYIAAEDQSGMAEAMARIESLTEEATIGKIYTGKVVRTTHFGAFVEILPGTDGLVPISQLADYRVPSVEDVVQEGDEIMVMVTQIDNEGKVRLSRQAVLEGWSIEKAREMDSRINTGGDNRRRGGRGRSNKGRGGGRR